MKKKIFFIKTHVPVGIGGPVPPLELLYVASQIEKDFGSYYNIRIMDTGIGDLSEQDVQKEIDQFKPDVICLYAMAWEAGLVHAIAASAKNCRKEAKIIISGQLASLAKHYLCEDPNIDYVVVGEPELTIVDLLRAFEGMKDSSAIDGIVYKKDQEIIATKPRTLPENINSLYISPSAWDLIDVRVYSRYANWNGSLKEKFYIPILTSRGCPFPCTFCSETYDKTYRARSPDNVIHEIKFLQDKFGVKEIHIFDAIFNYDIERAKNICHAIIDEGIDVSLAFPHGIRADIMTEDLIKLLKKAGTYKLVYGIETGSPRMQKIIKKNLDLVQVNRIISRTAQEGIITGGYFMLGFEGETEEEMSQTIDFAVRSDLDIASFFKATDYSDIIGVYRKQLEHKEKQPLFDFTDVSYYAVKGSKAQMSADTLNVMIIKAQRKFYLNLRRFYRGMKKYPHKLTYLRNFINAMGLILQGYLFQKLTPDHAQQGEQ